MKNLLDLDKKFFLFINSFNNNFFDIIFWYISNNLVWIPLYVLILYLLIRYISKNEIILNIILISLLIFLTDNIVFFVFKQNIQRLRPTHEPEIMNLVHIVNDYKGGKYGFFSSHASNSFGIAIFFGKKLKKRYPKLIYFLLIWASVVSYSRIYLGVHYPLDIMAGALWGGVIAYLLNSEYLVKVNRMVVDYLGFRWKK